jgi:DNA repair protein RadC
MPNSTRAGPSGQALLLLGGPDTLTYRQVMDAFAEYVATEQPKLDAPTDVASLMRPILAGREQEEFHVLLLDTKHRLIHDRMVTVGLLDCSQVHAREVFRPAIEFSASRVILVHQHPSGDPTPSANDIACTRNLVEAGKIIGIEVLDHVVIGRRSQSRPRDYLSFREENLLA